MLLLQKLDSPHYPSLGWHLRVDGGVWIHSLQSLQMLGYLVVVPHMIVLLHDDLQFHMCEPKKQLHRGIAVEKPIFGKVIFDFVDDGGAERGVE